MLYEILSREKNKAYISVRILLSVPLFSQALMHRDTDSATNALVPQITGATDVYLIIGDPVEQVRAPESFNRIFALLGLNAVLVPVQVSPAGLADFVKTVFRSTSIKGLWVTIPHKMPLLDILDHCAPLARVAGAVNAVRRNADGTLEGALFDGEGFLAGLDHDHIAYTGKRVMIVGAGGAACAIGASLALAGERACAELAVFDPQSDKAETLARRLGQAAGVKVRTAASADPAGFDLVINASPLGLKPGDPLPVDVARMGDAAALADILMKNQPTPVLQAVRARGLVAQPGFEMMIQQTHLYLDFFGFSAAAAQLRQDCGFLRQLIYPVALHRDIH